MPQDVMDKKSHSAGKIAAVVLGFCALAALGLCGGFLLGGGSPAELTPTAPAEAAATPTPPPPDTEPPVIEGPHDMTAAVGMTLSYRSGVTARDAVDGKVPLEVDASAVDLTQPGEYPVVYQAVDKAGNQAQRTVTLTVVAVSGVNDDDPTADVSGEESAPPLPPLPDVTREMVDEESRRILDKILSPSMSQWEQARAIYNYVHTHVKYVGSSDKSSWLIGAYVGFTRGRGDCYNYFACSKALLTLAGIPNVDLYRVGGNTDHYWQLVNVGSGWYHFDACPHPDSYPLASFLLDEAAVRAYTEKCTPVRTNYYVYDYQNCPVVPVGFPLEELPAETEMPTETETPPVTEQPLPGTEEGSLLPPGVLTTPGQPAGEPETPPAEEPFPTQSPPVTEAVPSPEPLPSDPVEPQPVPGGDQPSPGELIPPPPEAELPEGLIEVPGKEENP